MGLSVAEPRPQHKPHILVSITSIHFNLYLLRNSISPPSLQQVDRIASAAAPFAGAGATVGPVCNPNSVRSCVTVPLLLPDVPTASAGKLFSLSTNYSNSLQQMNQSDSLGSESCSIKRRVVSVLDRDFPRRCGFSGLRSKLEGSWTAFGRVSVSACVSLTGTGLMAGLHSH